MRGGGRTIQAEPEVGPGCMFLLFAAIPHIGCQPANGRLRFLSSESFSGGGASFRQPASVARNRSSILAF